MGKIEIDIPKDMERALETAFPGEDKAATVLRIIAERLALSPAGPGEPDFAVIVEEMRRIRAQPPFVTDEEIRLALDEMRS